MSLRWGTKDPQCKLCQHPYVDLERHWNEACQRIRAGQVIMHPQWSTRRHKSEWYCKRHESKRFRGYELHRGYGCTCYMSEPNPSTVAKSYENTPENRARSRCGQILLETNEWLCTKFKSYEKVCYTSGRGTQRRAKRHEESSCKCHSMVYERILEEERKQRELDLRNHRRGEELDPQLKEFTKMAEGLREKEELRQKKEAEAIQKQKAEARRKDEERKAREEAERNDATPATSTPSEDPCEEEESDDPDVIEMRRKAREAERQNDATSASSLPIKPSKSNRDSGDSKGSPPEAFDYNGECEGNSTRLNKPRRFSSAANGSNSSDWGPDKYYPDRLDDTWLCGDGQADVPASEDLPSSKMLRRRRLLQRLVRAETRGHA